MRDGGGELARVALTPDSQGISLAEIRWELPPPGTVRPTPRLELRGDGLTSDRPAPLEDLASLRQRTFQQGVRGGRGPAAPGWAVPRFAPAVLTGPEFPTLGYEDPDRIARVFGAVQVTTEFYDGQFRRVTSARRPGRYGAISRVISEVGESVAFHTFYRTERPVPADARAADLAAASEGSDWPQQADRDRWYPLQASRGLAMPYESHVRLPDSYDEYPDRLYPVIVYLHGSGGGERTATVLIDGPQAFAARTRGFDFILISLRSPGGWEPPQARDTLDRLAPTLRHDPALWYLSGFSMGGMGTWNVATDDPDRWAATAVVGGRTGDLPRMGRLKAVPAWVFNGQADITTTSRDALRAVEALRATGNPNVKWTEFHAADHTDSLRLVYAMPELFAWFPEHHKALYETPRRRG